MKRHHEKHDGFDVVVSENGVTTTTSTVMRLGVPEKDYSTPTYHPGSGINRELMLAVRDQIIANREWWNQDVWRQVVTSVTDLPEWDGGMDTGRDAIASVIAFNPDENEPACGTAMCFAGWAGELARADWVLDARTITKARAQAVYISHEATVVSLLFVRRDLWRKHLDEGDRYDGSAPWTYLNLFLIQEAERRGFTEATHALVPVDAYACMLLGLHSDPYNLFDGSNSYEYVLSAATVYATLDHPPSEITDRNHYALLNAAAASLGLEPDWDYETY